MKKQITIPSAIILLISLSTSIFANKTPNYPKGFSTKTKSGISFTENKGQIHDQNYKSRPDVLFGGSDGNLVFHLKNNGISYQLNRVDTWKKESDLIKNHADAKIQKDEEKLVADQSTIYRLDINWLNANTDIEVTKQKPLAGFNNYYLENCPNGALNVKSYQQITYQNIYDGIDLKWYEKDGHLEYDYLVSAGADYKQIQLEIKGAEKISINKKGELIYKTPLGDIIEQAPLVKQNGNTLKSKWIIKNNILSFEIENMNKSQAFIIDPVVRTWGTYYGGIGYDAMADFNIGNCSTDASGNVYLCGYTNTSSGISIATAGSHQSTFGGGSNDGYLVKFNGSGIRLWSTYYGGSGNDLAFASSVDPFGNIYTVGWTSSNIGTTIATLGSHQPLIGGLFDAFLVKFNSSGVRQWGTYYGDIGGENAFGCAIDASGNVYMAGTATGATLGITIATIGSHQSTSSDSQDAFLVKFNPSGIRQWGTFYGGDSWDTGTSCSVDASGNVYLAGVTTSTNIGTAIATAGSHQTIFGGSNDAFLVKFNSAGVRQWGTFYGGFGSDGVGILSYEVSCKTDNANNIYLFGSTSTNTGTAISSPGSHQQNFGGGTSDAYLVKFNSSGVRQWGTYYGHIGNEFGFSCTTNSSGDVFITGTTTSSISVTSIATAGNHQSIYGGGFYDAYLVKFNTSGIRQWGTFYGGTGLDSGNSCATDGSGNVYLNGFTDLASGTAIATPGSHQSTYSGGGDAYLVKFIDCPTSTITASSGAICLGNSYTISPSGSSTYTFASSTATISGINALVSPTVTTIYTISGTSTLGCLSTNDAIVTITVNALPIIAVNSGSICSGQSFTMIPGGAITYTYSSGSNVVSPLTNTNYSVSGSSVLGCVGSNTAISTVTVNPNPTITVNSGVICAGQSFTINPNGANTYIIQGGNAVVSPTTNATYTVAGTSTAGCVSQALATSSLIVNPNPTILVNSSAICAGQNFTINPTGANTYTIQGGNAVVSPPSNTSFTVAGTNTLTGCVSQVAATSSLIVNANPIIAVNSGSICAGQNFSINPTGANTFTIQGGNAVVSPPSNTSFTVAGTNTLTGCVSQVAATSSLIVNANPIIAVNSGSICAGQNFSINPTGANTFTIQGGNAVVSPPSNTSYTVIGTNSVTGCRSQAFATSNLIVNPNPIITVNSGTICAGQSFTINPNGANTYTIQGGNPVVSPPSNASYTVIGTNSVTGCRSQAFATSNLIVNPNPIITVNSGTICAGQSFTINPNGANTYTIQGGNPVVSPPSNASYTVIGTNSVTGCRSQVFATSNLTVNPNPTITVNSGSICAGQSFTINSNGVNTYTIQGGNPVVSPNSNSSYTVAGTSTSGCKSQGFATSNLTVNANPTITVNSGLICAGENFTIYPSGANTYTIQGGNAVVSPTINITYTVAGTNTAGCVSQALATSSLTVNLCVGITNQTMGIGGVSIYPNPNNGEFTIELVSVNNTYITITNVLGQIIKTQKAELMNRINLNTFDKGIYFISVMDNNQSVYRGSIIKE